MRRFVNWRRPLHAVGVDFGYSGVKVVALSADRGELTVLGAGIEPVPPGALRDGAVRDAGAVGAALGRLLARLRVRCRVLTLAIGGGSVLVKRFSVPPEAVAAGVTPGGLRDAVAREAARHVPFHLESLEFDYEGPLPAARRGRPETRRGKAWRRSSSALRPARSSSNTAAPPRPRAGKRPGSNSSPTRCTRPWGWRTASPAWIGIRARWQSWRWEPPAPESTSSGMRARAVPRSATGPGPGHPGAGGGPGRPARERSRARRRGAGGGRSFDGRGVRSRAGSSGKPAAGPVAGGPRRQARRPFPTALGRPPGRRSGRPGWGR